MTPWDLIIWALAVGASLIILAGPICLVAAAFTLGRLGK